jgi:predicted HAD superfamily Cof-like phosphohydrolase
MEQLVEDFMQKNRQEIRIVPTFPSYEIRTLRRKLIMEEVDELLDAISNNDLVGIADGIADAQIVIIGTALAYGIPTYEVFLEAHEANMSKNGPLNDFGKITKGDGYKQPNFGRVLRSMGWRG